MRRTKIEWAELHAPLFLSSTNLSQKLDPKHRSGLEMEYDEELRHLFVTYNKKTCRIPDGSILNMVEAKASVSELKAPPFEATSQGKPIEAQVSSPTMHVFAGAGGGQTGQETPKVRGPMETAFEKARK